MAKSTAKANKKIRNLAKAVKKGNYRREKIGTKGKLPCRSYKKKRDIY